MTGTATRRRLPQVPVGRPPRCTELTASRPLGERRVASSTNPSLASAGEPCQIRATKLPIPCQVQRITRLPVISGGL